MASFLKLQTGDYLLLQGGGKLILATSTNLGVVGQGGRLSRDHRKERDDDDNEIFDLLRRMMGRIDP